MESAKKSASGIDLAPYRARLAALIDTLERALQTGATVALVRLPVERLGELLEDLESIGAAELARGLTPIVMRLRQALAAANADATISAAVTAALDELRALAAGTPPRPPSRLAFWK